MRNERGHLPIVAQFQIGSVVQHLSHQHAMTGGWILLGVSREELVDDPADAGGIRQSVDMDVG